MILKDAFGPPSGRKSKIKIKNVPASFRDDEFYMSHYQKDAETERGFAPIPSIQVRCLTIFTGTHSVMVQHSLNRLRK